MQTLIRVECCARMRRETRCRTFREWDASRRGAVIGQREVRNRSGRWACGMACGNNTDYVRFFGRRRASVATRALASGATRNGRRARDAGRSYRWLPVCLSFGRPPLLGARGSGGHRSQRPMKDGRAVEQTGAQSPSAGSGPWAASIESPGPFNNVVP
jgi:hypothetical protein